MCGIAGYFGYQNRELLEQMNACQKHRGPNGDGIYMHGQVGLAHRRLSIIDVANGMQPMTTKDGRYTICYNGEVYNYLQLRQELESLGAVFETDSDTEVILQAYAYWGTAAFDRFNGMFGVAYYDQQEEKLVVVRDQFGIKPVYYWYDADKHQLLFSSEIKSLLATQQMQAEANDAIIYQYLKYRVQDNSKETFFKNIYRLMPGDMLEITKDKFEITTYSQLKDTLKQAMTKKLPYNKERVALYREGLIESIALRLQSEVKVGTSLSGGLDSSTVAAVISDLLKHDKDLASVGTQQTTFSAVFPNSINDEENYIDDLLAMYGHTIEAHKIYPSAEGFFADLDDFVRTQEEPIVSTGPYAQYAVMREASKHVTVLLDGQGADEMMAGYNPYAAVYLRQLKAEKKWGKFIKEAWYFRDILKKLVRHYWHQKVHKKKNQTITDLLAPDFVTAYPEVKMTVVQNHLKRRLFDDLFYNSLPSLLRYEDKNTMRFSLEGRVPFIDKNLVEMIFETDDEAIIKDGWNKAILRDSMESYLPKTIARRRKKIGFTTPEQEWFVSHKDVLLTILQSESFGKRPYFNQEAIVKEFLLFTEGKSQYSTMEFWRFINVELWLRAFID